MGRRATCHRFLAALVTAVLALRGGWHGWALAAAVFDPKICDASEVLLAIHMPGNKALRMQRQFDWVRKHAYRSPKGRRVGCEVYNWGEDGELRSSLLLFKKGLREVDVPAEVLSEVEAGGGSLMQHELRWGYEQLGYREALRLLLPDHVKLATGYEIVGHLARFNLDEVQWPYRHLIGRVCLDKTKKLRTVVAKVGDLSGDFRTFDMEVIAGDDDTNISLRECGLRLEFDFSKVFWNTKLRGERERVVKQIDEVDAVWDLCAGVGATALLCARKGCKVLANDLNPAAAQALRHNAALNRLPFRVEQEPLEELLPRLLLSGSGSARTHLLLNLPECGLELLAGVLRPLWQESPPEGLAASSEKLHVRCYCFGYEVEEVRERLWQQQLGSLPAGTTIREVRSVAKAKMMYCLEFTLALLRSGQETLRVSHALRGP